VVLRRSARPRKHSVPAPQTSAWQDIIGISVCTVDRSRRHFGSRAWEQIGSRQVRSTALNRIQRLPTAWPDVQKSRFCRSETLLILVDTEVLFEPLSTALNRRDHAGNGCELARACATSWGEDIPRTELYSPPGLGQPTTDRRRGHRPQLPLKRHDQTRYPQPDRECSTRGSSTPGCSSVRVGFLW
jgi:hypothetical protein